jgi:hypothetical protein
MQRLGTTVTWQTSSSVRYHFLKYLSHSSSVFIISMWILYLKFKLSNEKTAFVPRDSVIFYGISLKFIISQSSVGYYNIPR